MSYDYPDNMIDHSPSLATAVARFATWQEAVACIPKRLTWVNEQRRIYKDGDRWVFEWRHYA